VRDPDDRAAPPPPPTTTIRGRRVRWTVQPGETRPASAVSPAAPCSRSPLQRPQPDTPARRRVDHHDPGVSDARRCHADGRRRRGVAAEPDRVTEPMRSIRSLDRPRKRSADASPTSSTLRAMSSRAQHRDRLHPRRHADMAAAHGTVLLVLAYNVVRPPAIRRRRRAPGRRRPRPPSPAACAVRGRSSDGRLPGPARHGDVVAPAPVSGSAHRHGPSAEALGKHFSKPGVPASSTSSTRTVLRSGAVSTPTTLTRPSDRQPSLHRPSTAGVAIDECRRGPSAAGTSRYE
jgi:hypothetical protein